MSDENTNSEIEQEVVESTEESTEEETKEVTETARHPRTAKDLFKSLSEKLRNKEIKILDGRGFKGLDHKRDLARPNQNRKK
jgi:hypothetical protein